MSLATHHITQYNYYEYYDEQYQYHSCQYYHMCNISQGIMICPNTNDIYSTTGNSNYWLINVIKILVMCDMKYFFMLPITIIAHKIYHDMIIIMIYPTKQ